MSVLFNGIDTDLDLSSFQCDDNLVNAPIDDIVRINFDEKLILSKPVQAFLTIMSVPSQYPAARQAGQVRPFGLTTNRVSDL